LVPKDRSKTAKTPMGKLNGKQGSDLVHRKAKPQRRYELLEPKKRHARSKSVPQANTGAAELLPTVLAAVHPHGKINVGEKRECCFSKKNNRSRRSGTPHTWGKGEKE